MSNRLVLFSIFFSLVSCAVTEQKKLSYSDEIPSFFLPKQEELHAVMDRPERAPASFEEQSEGRPTMSTKRLYFLTLLQQYYDFQVVTQEREDVVSCPHFHHDVVVQSEKGNLSRNDVQSFYHYIQHPQHQSWRDKLKEYQKLVKEEVQELCEYGESDSYFVFVNYLRYLKGNKGFSQSEKSFRSVLKIPIVANLYLLRPMLGQSGIVSLNSYEKRVLVRVDARWMSGLLYNLAKRRYYRNQERKLVSRKP